MKSDALRMLYGFLILAVLAVLAGMVALGHIEEKTSYGLMAIISSLGTLAGSWGQWAFSARSGIDAQKKQEVSDESKSEAQVSAQGSAV